MEKTYMSLTAKHTKLATLTEKDSRWTAVIARDPSADGQFYYSVKTSGVYCRPSCPARLAKPQNVQFHDMREDAERAGFCPCKRCVPDQSSLVEKHGEKVATICRLIENSQIEPSLDDLAHHAGLSVYYFHRVFKAITGLTPKAYAAAHRANRVRSELDRSSTITAAIYGAGYNSNGRFYAASPKYWA
ncbi:MAG: bifunctional transcriptional activator/DNA repair enzyme AdaA [Methylococcaceae bacterium]|nr:bifunctional transcriptional activator/DNA repair enzyme AdaA [Methylococcaceae bacterium]